MTAWKDMVREHGPPPYRAAWRIPHDAQDYEDVVQEVFIEAHALIMRGEIAYLRTLLNPLVPAATWGASFFMQVN